MCGVGGCLHLSMHRHASSSSELESFDEEGRKEPNVQDFCYFLKCLLCVVAPLEGGNPAENLAGRM